MSSGPIYHPTRLPHIVLWIWIHLLQFDISNQTQSPEEDALNKAYRPLPSKRVSLEAAIAVRWALVPACLIISALYSRAVLLSSFALISLTVVYNELAFHARHWLVRNMVNAAGFASFELGATLIASA